MARRRVNPRLKQPDKPKNSFFTRFTLPWMISTVIAVGWIAYQLVVQTPKLTEFAAIKREYPVVQDIAEAKQIASAIPVPEPRGSYRNLDYFPTAVFKMSTDTPGYFPDAIYGFILELKTNTHSYVATDSSANVSDKRIVFSVSELRSVRNDLSWVPYDQPMPPPGWARLK